MDKRSFLKQQEGSGLLVPTILHSVSLADELSEERLSLTSSIFQKKALVYHSLLLKTQVPGMVHLGAHPI